ncbi:phage portal protein [Magnetospirillum molischianum]|uniref:Putative Phage portal protein, HK97 family n=1 Tax=Magnetospirillum molischianum DSM 120 TaxID=1150626 RepID=H8FWW6_MAGML|nr:phage portal protein [Magnetospirillum molischianum]CCG42854.1 putative Phage portal protein, HK97 family [Magnetospirillum molischianum DSM 120]
MSLLDRIASRFGFERRAGGFGDLPGIALTGHPVNSRTAENLSAVLACVSAVSTAIASLPAYVYREGEAGRDIDRSHPLNRLVVRGPNPWQTWPDFVEWLVASTLLRGNGLAEIVTDPRGAVVELRPIPWDWVSVQLLPSGRLAYDVTEQMGIWGATGRLRRLLQGEVLHLRDRSDDGLLGRSRLSRATEVVGAGIALQEASGALWRNGVFPSGALSVEGKLSPDQLKDLREGLADVHTGAARHGKVLILQGGMKWSQITISPEDAEILESRRFSVEEIARLYQVPPPIIQDYTHNTFTNSEAAGRWFAQFTIGPWVRKLEAEFSRGVLSEGDSRSMEFDLSGFMRGDYAARWKAHEIAVRNDILTRNEVREIEGWNPRPEAEKPPPQPSAPTAPTVQPEA